VSFFFSAASRLVSAKLLRQKPTPCCTVEEEGARPRSCSVLILALEDMKRLSPMTAPVSRFRPRSFIDAVLPIRLTVVAYDEESR